MRARCLSRPIWLSAWGLLLNITKLSAAIHYVDVKSATPTPPYTNWATAANVLQDAVDAAAAGDEIVVTNGTYRTGGRVVDGTLSNRLAVTKPLTVRSANGPTNTIIQGYQVPGSTNGDGAMRCVYLAEGAVLSGFTLIGGATLTAGSNAELSGGGVWCASALAMVTNCALTGNSAHHGGGAYGGTLNNCALMGNSTYYDGGGAYESILNECRLIGNATYWDGGGAFNSTLNHCTLADNSAGYGGGASGAVLNNCRLTGNSAWNVGGGTYSSALNNCALTHNSARSFGGGAARGVLNNCTLTGNSTVFDGGGTSWCSLNNCIIYFNRARRSANSDSLSTLNYCCTAPLPSDGVGNISLDPQLAGTFRLSAVSACRNAGNPAYAFGMDIDDEPWGDPPSIGCDEFLDGNATGPLSAVPVVTYTNVATGFTVDLTALIEGRPMASEWDFGDGQTATNQAYTGHSWDLAGDYLVRLTAYDEGVPAGVNATVTIHVEDVVHHVVPGNAKSASPYASWETAAGDIQSAVDVAAAGALVLVTNGVYAVGSRVVVGQPTNRVAVLKPMVVRSLNGPNFTTIEGFKLPGTTIGDGAVRCVYLADGAVLSGFTLTNGSTLDSNGQQGRGGGVWCASYNALVTNCVFVGNSAVAGGAVNSGTLNRCALMENQAVFGGGAASSTLNNCTLRGNSAIADGGGAYSCTLNNCTLTGNSARDYGGGADSSQLNNCIVYLNTAGNGANHSLGNLLNSCCTVPVPANADFNITNEPAFVNRAAGNLRLQLNSPCINAGSNLFPVGDADLDGRPRIVGGTVDIGAYEFQPGLSGEFLAWLQHYGLPADGSADSTDPDGDGHNNWQEWIAGTNPTNVLSVLRMLNSATSPFGVVVSWQSIADRTYVLERGTNVDSSETFVLLRSDIIGRSGTTAFTDTNALGSGPFFYRVTVQH